MNLKKLFMMLSFLFLLGTTTFAQTNWYVNAATGNDAYDGTQAAFSAGLVGPKATISAMLASPFVVNGDIINIAGNTYAETVVLTKRVELLATGSAVTILNLTLNTGSSTATEINNDASNIDLIVSGTLLVQSGRYTIETADFVLGSGATEELVVGTGTLGFNASPTATNNDYFLKFSNNAALAYDATDIPAAGQDAKDITFAGSATVTLPANLLANRDVTITSGTVAIGANTLSVGRHFANNSVTGYTTAAAGSVILAATGNVSGAGPFQNLTTAAAAITTTLTSNITFVNIDAVTNSTYTLGAGATLALSTFTLTTPGNIVDLSGAANITNGTGGTIVMNGSVTQSFQIPNSQNTTIGNFTINKPTGSILNLVTATNTVGNMGSFTFTKKFDFVSGQLETNFNNVVIGAAHGTVANIGGPINRAGTSTGVFNLINTTNGVVFGGTGQINIPVLNASTGMTNEFTLLTAIGSNLTVTDGILKTASLTLVNGNISVYGGGTLTMNGSTVSVTGNMSVGDGANTAGTITGTSNVTVSGAASFVGSSATSKIDLTTAGSTPAGNLTVTGSLTDGSAGTSVRANTLNVGTLIQTTGSTVTTLANLVVGAGGVTGSVAALTVGGNFQSTGAVVFDAGAKAITGTFTALSTVTTGAGTVTITSTAAITGNLTVGTGAFAINGTGLSTFGANVLNGAGAATLTIAGTSTIAGNVTDNGGAGNTFVVTFNRATTITGNIAFTIAAGGSKVVFGSAAGRGAQVSSVKNITYANAVAGDITINSTSATDNHSLGITGDVTLTANAGGAIVLGNNSKLIFNGTATLVATPANQQVINVASALTIAGTGSVEFANSGAGSTAETDPSVNFPTAVNFECPNIILTSNGVSGANLALTANGTITRTGGRISSAAAGINVARNLVYNNASDLTTGIEFSTNATNVANLTLTTGFAGKVTLSAALTPTITGILTVASGRELALGANVLTVAKTTTGTNISVAGTVSGTGKVALTVPAAAVTIAGAGTMGNLDVNFGANDQVVTLTGPSTLTGNFLSSGGAAVGTLTFDTGSFTTVLGTTTLDNKTINLPTAGFTATGSLTHTAGTVVFPTGTGNFTLLAAANSIAGGLTYDFTTNTNVFGRLNLMGSAAQTLTLGGPQTVARVNINNAAGVTIQAFTLTATDLYLTSGLLTHNGLLATTSITRKITDTTNGQIATQPASGPANVTYVGTASGSTGPELLGVLTTLTINSDIGFNPTITLASGTTIVNGGTLNLSRGTLAAGTNLTFAAGTETVIRADGTLTGTPAFNGTVNLQYLNSTAITTGTEWSSPTAVGTVLVNCLGTTLTLGQNSTATGLVTVSFGTLDLGNFSLSLAAGLTNNATVSTSGTGFLNYTGTFTLNGTATSYPKTVVNGTGITLTAPALTTVTLNGDLVVTKGTFSVGGATTLVVKGNIDIQTTATAFTDNGKVVKLTGNFSIVGDDATPAANPIITQSAGTLEFNGTTAQTITTRQSTNKGYLNKVKINNAAGVTLLTNVVLDDGKNLDLTLGNITTGSFSLQLGTGAVATITNASKNSYVNGNLNRWAKSDLTVGDVLGGKYVFPLGTSDGKYRPVTIVFPGTIGTGVNHIIKINHTNSAVTATVGIPFTNAGVTINKLAPLYWTIGMYDATAPTGLLTPTNNPQVTFGAGGVTFGDLSLTRAVYRLTSPLNTWTMPGTVGVPYYDVNDVATIVHSGVQGWATEPQQLFAIGYASNFVVANALTAQTLVVGGTAYTKDVNAAPAVFSGSQGTLVYTVTSSDVTKATATIVAGVLTVTAVAEGTSTITVTATDVNGEQKTSSFVATVQAKPTFTLPVASTFTVAEAATSGNTVVFAASGTAGITYTMIPNTPALTWAAFDAATATLTLTPTYGVAGAVTGGVYTITIRATGTNGLFTDKVLTVTVTTTLRNPVWTGTGTSTIATKSIKYNEAFTYSYVAVSPDNHTITYSLESVTPATTAAVFSHQAGLGGFGQLTFTPTTAEAGKVYTIVVKATASSGLFSTTTTVLTVGINNAPTFVLFDVARTVKVHNVPVAVTFQYTATDADGDPFTWTLVSGKGFISTTGLYTWTPVAADKGTTNTVKVRITDAANPLIFTETTAVLTVENLITSVESIEGVPTNFALLQNYPNPFNPSTTIQFAIPTSSNVKVSVFNILGEEVAVLVNSMMAAGNYKVSFNASNLPSGLYLYRIQADNFNQVRKMMLTK